MFKCNRWYVKKYFAPSPLIWIPGYALVRNNHNLIIKLTFGPVKINFEHSLWMYCQNPTRFTCGAFHKCIHQNRKSIALKPYLWSCFYRRSIIASNQMRHFIVAYGWRFRHVRRIFKNYVVTDIFKKFYQTEQMLPLFHC